MIYLCNIMKWYSGIKKKVLKRHITHIVVDGVWHPIARWEKGIKYVLSLKKGDTIFNPYRQILTQVKDVEVNWAPIGRGRYIFDFIIVDSLDDCIYDFPYCRMGK